MFPGRHTVEINKVCIGLRGDEQFACLCWLLMKSIVAWGQSVLLHRTNLGTMGLINREQRQVKIHVLTRQGFALSVILVICI